MTEATGWLLAAIPVLGLLAAGCVRSGRPNTSASALVLAAFLGSLFVVARLAFVDGDMYPYPRLSWFSISNTNISLYLTADRLRGAMLALVCGIAAIAWFIDNEAESDASISPRILLCLSLSALSLIVLIDEMLVAAGLVFGLSCLASLLVREPRASRAWLSGQLVGDFMLFAASMLFIERIAEFGRGGEFAAYVREPWIASVLWIAGLLVKAIAPSSSGDAAPIGRVWHTVCVPTTCLFFASATTATLVKDSGRPHLALIVALAALSLVIAAWRARHLMRVLSCVLAANTMLALSATSIGTLASSASALAHLVVSVCAVTLLSLAVDDRTRPSNPVLTLAVLSLGAFPMFGTFWTASAICEQLLLWEALDAWALRWVLAVALFMYLASQGALAIKIGNSLRESAPAAATMPQQFIFWIVAATSAFGGLAMFAAGALRPHIAATAAEAPSGAWRLLVEINQPPFDDALVAAAVIAGWTFGGLAVWRGWVAPIGSTYMPVDRPEPLARLSEMLRHFDDRALGSAARAVQRTTAAAEQWLHVVHPEALQPALTMAGLCTVAIVAVVTLLYR